MQIVFLSLLLLFLREVSPVFDTIISSFWEEEKGKHVSATYSIRVMRNEKMMWGIDIVLQPARKHS